MIMPEDAHHRTYKVLKRNLLSIIEDWKVDGILWKGRSLQNGGRVSFRANTSAYEAGKWMRWIEDKNEKAIGRQKQPRKLTKG